MASMIPELDGHAIQDISSQAERKVYLALRDTLPEKILVLHSFQFTQQRDGSKPIDGEADFVVFDADRGILVIEVKGGGIEVDRTKQQWHSIDRHGGRHAIKDPIAQAKRNKYALIDTLRSAYGGEVSNWVIGHAALFPDLSSGISQLVSHNAPEQLLGSHSDLQDLGAWIPQCTAYWRGQDGRREAPGPTSIALAKKLFSGTVRVKAPLAVQIANEAEVLFELTEKQAGILHHLRRHRRAVIAGGAGTGKTLLALTQAKSLAAAGHKTLLLCYNTVLGDFLKRECNGIENLHAMTAHQLCTWRVGVIEEVTGIHLSANAKSAFPGSSWMDVQLPFAAACSTEHDDFRYQAIVVDEGQDFTQELWMPVELMLEDFNESYFYIFMDSNQSIFRNQSVIPIKEEPYLLQGNCRNTRPIHEAAYRFYQGEEVQVPDLPGEPIVWIDECELDRQAIRVRKLVTKLMADEHLKPDDIAVLIWSGKIDNVIRPLLEKAGDPTGAQWSFQSHWQNRRVLVESVRRFKGMEASVIILWLDEAANPSRDDDCRKLYVGLSRARSRMWIVGQSLESIRATIEQVNQ